MTLRRLFAGILLGLLLGTTACIKVYPSFMDSPEFQAALVETVKSSNKTWELENEFNDPEIELYVKQSIGAIIHRVNSRANIRGGSGAELQPNG